MWPLLPFFLVYLGGVLAALPAPANFIFPGLLPSTLIVCGLILYRKKPDRKLAGWVLLALLTGYGLLASGWTETHRPDNHILNHIQEGQSADIIGKIIETPIVFPNRVQYHLELVSVQYKDRLQPVTGIARINNFSTENPANLGDIVRLKKIRLKLPRNFKNPGGFDYRQYFRFLGIDVTGNTSKSTDIERLGSYNPSKIKITLATVKHAMMQTTDNHLSLEEGALLKGVVLGETQSLPDDLQEAYKVTGLAHLLAVSGMNFTFLAAAIYLVCNRLVFVLCIRYFPRAAKSGLTRKIIALLCLPPIVFYMLLVGIKISSIRAGVMVIIFLLSVLVDRENEMFNSLLISAFLILLVSPDAIINVSFQLSFAAVFFILYAALFYEIIPQDPIGLMGQENQSLKNAIKLNLLVSVSATLGTLPILLYIFNRVSLVGVALNLVMVPLSVFLMPFGLFVLTLGLVSQDLAGWLMPICSLLLKLFIYIPKWAATIPYTSIYLPTPPRLWLVLYYFVLIGLPWWLNKNWKTLFSHNADDRANPLNNKSLCAGLGIASLWVIVWLVWPRFPEPPTETLSVCVLDVGQGESIFIEFPNHKTLLIDGGGFYKNAPDVGKTILAPFLWNKGIGEINYMVATHSDNDHISGLESLMGFFPVENYFARREDILDDRLWRLRKAALQHHTKLIALETGKPLEIGGVNLIPLHPDMDYSNKHNPKGAVKNNTSLVLRLEYRTFNMLLTGDMAEQAEQHLVGNSAPLQANFLKAPHHGSKHSSTPAFINAVSPKDVIFSSGYLNPFNHPNPEVLERYKNIGTKIHRTDRDGAICITTDGLDHRIETHENL